MLVFKKSKSWILFIVFAVTLLLTLVQIFYKFGLIGFLWSLLLNDSFERFYQNPVNLEYSRIIDILGWLLIALSIFGLMVGAHFKKHVFEKDEQTNL